MGLELKLTGFNRDSATALYLAKAGIERAGAVIKSKTDHTVDSLNEQWSCNNDNEETKPLFKEIKIGDAGSFTVSYPFHDNRIFYGAQDEEGRVNINTASKDVIARLIVFVDQTVENYDEIAANIIDWRDSDPGNIRQHVDYSEEGYTRKGAAFDSLDEILLVKGVKDADQGLLFDKIKGYITVYTTADSGKININTAPLQVLEALGFSGTGTDAGAIITARAGPNGIEGDGNDTTFDQYSFAPYLAKLTPDDAKLVSYGSKYFRVISKGTAYSGRVTKTVTCVISVTTTTGSTPTANILYWNEE